MSSTSFYNSSTLSSLPTASVAGKSPYSGSSWSSPTSYDRDQELEARARGPGRLMGSTLDSEKYHVSNIISSFLIPIDSCAKLFREPMIRPPSDVWTALEGLARQIDNLTTQNANLQRLVQHVRHTQEKSIVSQQEFEKTVWYAYSQLTYMRHI